MIIKKLQVSGYKNLRGVDIDLDGLHVVTGVNNAGKSNLLEVIPFVSSMIFGTESDRVSILQGSYGGSMWFPVTSSKESIDPFTFSLSGVIQVGKKKFEFEYQLTLAIQGFSEHVYTAITSCHFASESFSYSRVAGGRKIRKTIVERSTLNTFSSRAESPARKNDPAKVKSTMSALQALESLEGDDFPLHYPVLSRFKKGMATSMLFGLDPISLREILSEPIRRTLEALHSGGLIRNFDPFKIIEKLHESESSWRSFISWLQPLCGIEDIHVASSRESSESSPKYEFLFPKVRGRYLGMEQMSSGTALIIAYLTIAFSLAPLGGVILLEEPENHLHPRAIADLIKLFRSTSNDHTVFISTHSPILLNCLHSREVSWLKPLNDGFVTTVSVQNIRSAQDSLSRGFTSLGELLEINYGTSDED